VKKIPVGRTIAFAYDFAFNHLGTIIGLIWFPMILIAVASFLPYALGTAQFDPAQNINDAGRAAAINLSCSIVSLILYSVIYVVVTRQALGLRRGSASFHFALGAPEWRMLGAMILVALVIALLLVIYIVAAVVVVAIASRAGPVAGSAAVLLAILAGLGLMLFLAFRFGFLLSPMVVVEETMSLSRSWTLSQGNFWRIFLIFLAVSLPFLAVQFAVMFWVAGPGLFAPFPAGVDFAAALQQRMLMFDQHMPVSLGLTLFLAPFSFGMNLGAQAFAYRSLVPLRPDLSAGTGAV
jgi:hypothetical protein